MNEFIGRSGPRFLAAILLPTIVVLLYTAFWASPMYVSNSMFAIRSMDSGGYGGGADLVSQFMIGGSSSTLGDSYLISNYVQSWDIFSKIDQELNLKNHYSDSGKDIVSRLNRDSTQVRILDYWRWAVGLTFDPDTGIIKCRVKAYSPEMAWRINQAVIEHSEALINEINRRGREDSLALAKAEVKLAEDRLSKAHAAVRTMREQTTILSPQSESETLHGVISTLEGQAARLAAELREAEAYMRSDSPTVQTLKRRLEGLNSQLGAERGKLSGLSLTGNQTMSYLSGVLSQFEDLQMEEEFARQHYSSAMTALENARIRNESKSRYLVAFEPPRLPDESRYPLIFRSVVITFFGAALVFGLLSLVVAAIREHAGF